MLLIPKLKCYQVLSSLVSSRLVSSRPEDHVMNRSKAYRYEYAALKGKNRYNLPTGFINSLASDFDLGQYLLCGGADSSIRIFDLSNDTCDPAASIQPKTAHQFGVSKVAWWLKDNGMFLSGSFDQTICLWDTDNLEPVYTFNVEHKVYNFDINASGIVACALDHPYIQLLDTRSGSQSHILKGHKGKVLSCKWNPQSEYILASSGSDGTVKLWDIRNARSMLTCLDMRRTSLKQELEPIEFRRSHRSEVNGLQWHPDGLCLVSMGNDNKVSVWDASTEGGINLGMNFGPLVQNRFLQNNDPILSPPRHRVSTKLFVNVDSGQVLMFELESGRLESRLVPPGGANSSRQACTIFRNTAAVEYYSGDGKGNITKWARIPKTKDQVVEQLEQANPPELEPEVPQVPTYRLGDFI